MGIYLYENERCYGKTRIRKYYYEKSKEAYDHVYNECDLHQSFVDNGNYYKSLTRLIDEFNSFDFDLSFSFARTNAKSHYNGQEVEETTSDRR